MFCCIKSLLTDGKCRLYCYLLLFVYHRGCFLPFSLHREQKRFGPNDHMKNHAPASPSLRKSFLQKISRSSYDVISVKNCLSIDYSQLLYSSVCLIVMLSLKWYASIIGIKFVDFNTRLNLLHYGTAVLDVKSPRIIILSLAGALLFMPGV